MTKPQLTTSGTVAQRHTCCTSTLCMILSKGWQVFDDQYLHTCINSAASNKKITIQNTLDNCSTFANGFLD